MKAYKVWDSADQDGCSTIVFAENLREAKKLATSTDVCEYANYIDIRAKRLKAADELYKGKWEIDWYDNETRLALVKYFGWGCSDISFECDVCVAVRWCRHWAEEQEAEEQW